MKKIAVCLMSLLLLLGGISCADTSVTIPPDEEAAVLINTVVPSSDTYVTEMLSQVEYTEPPVEEEADILPQEDIDLIALVTMAEAEGECEEGKRLVIDTILNRMDSEHFPDTAYDVIYQKNQFSSMWNGRVDRCYVMDEIVQLVREELKDRTNYEVMFFNAGHYSAYGVPMFQVEHHYFSSYN